MTKDSKLLNPNHVRRQSFLFLILWLLFKCIAHAAIPADFSEQNQVIMAIYLTDGTMISDGIDTYQNGNDWYVPLTSLVESLGLAITVSPSLGRAEGFAFEENNEFKMDKTSCTAIANKQEASFNCGDVITYDDEIYVLSSLLEQWFIIKFRFDPFASTIIVMSDRKFPKQLRRDRDYEAQSITARLNQPPEGYTEQPVLDKKLGEGSFDQQISYEQKEKDNTKNTYFRHDTIAAIEIMGFETKGFLGGENNKITESSLSISKKDPHSQLLGPLKARSIEILDLTLPSLPLISTSTRAQGFQVSSFPLNQPNNFTTKDFRGPLPSNWEVELYQNDILIGRQISGIATEYEFKNITLYYGVNRFRTRFYGPQGQRKEQTEVINVGEQSAQPTESYYRFGSGTRVDKSNQLLSLIQVKHGFSSNFNSGLSYFQQHDRDNQETTEYGLIDFSGSFFRFYGALNFAANGDSGKAIEATIQAPFENFSLGYSHSNLSKFRSSLFNANDNRMVQRVDKLNGNISLAPLIPMRLDAEVLQTQYDDGDSRTEVKQRTSWQTWNSYWFNTITTNSEDQQNLEGEILMIVPVRRYEFRSAAGYSESLINFSASLEYRISDKYSYDAELQYNWEKRLTSVSATVNRLFRHITLSGELMTDSNRDYRAIVLASYSGTYSPRSNNFEWSSRAQTPFGAASARVFLDNDYDGVFSDGDTPMKEISMRVNQNDIDSETNENGDVMLLGLPAYQTTDVTVALKSLPDPYYRPAKKGIRLVPRPGQVCQLEFPIVIYSEIDGLVQVERKNGLRGLRNILVELKNSNNDVIATTKTESDGFYHFEDVPPGEYQVTLNLEKSEIKDIEFMQTSHSVTISKSGTSESSQDFRGLYKGIKNH